MITIPMNTKGAFDRSTLSDINSSFRQGAVNAQNIASINKPRITGGSPGSGSAGGTSPVHAAGTAANQIRPAGTQREKSPAPPLYNPIKKGQKTVLAPGRPLPAVHACFGWETVDSRCDLDVSAFLLTENGKVPGDSWFVFYGQTVSPDLSTSFHEEENAAHREKLSIQLTRLNPSVKKIVFVLTINDALENGLNFGMVKDAYVRILDADGRTELVSFRMTDYYSNVISMMIGELYLHNGIWKFNAIGNGVARDLAGLCELYGVEVRNC